MSRYYLMPQLPSLDGVDESSPLPVTEERFNELCGRFLDKKSLEILSKLTLSPSREPDKTGSRLVDSWNEGERELRLALGSVRASKRKKAFDSGYTFLSPQMLSAAKNAVESDDPLSAERQLNRIRLELLEMLRPLDPFERDSIFYYGLKLKLILRMKQFDEDRGQNAYRSIYDSIIREDVQEARQ